MAGLGKSGWRGSAGAGGVGGPPGARGRVIIKGHWQGGAIVGSITISGLDDGLIERLRERAEANGRTLEEEARGILVNAAPYIHPPPENLAEAIRSIFEPLGGVELELPTRGFANEPPWFGWEEEEVSDKGQRSRRRAYGKKHHD